MSWIKSMWPGKCRACGARHEKGGQVWFVRGVRGVLCRPCTTGKEEVKEANGETAQAGVASIGKSWRFESMADFAKAIEGGEHDGRSMGSWHDSREKSRETVLDHAKNGDDGLVGAAEEVLRRLEGKIDFAAGAPRWDNDVCGAFPDVPAFLAGVPEDMRRKVIVDSEQAPIRIVVCKTSSAGIDAAVVMKRGVACLALAMLLAQTRPVSLEVFDCLGNGEKKNPDDYVVSVVVNTGTFCLSQAAFALTSTAASRWMGYGFLRNKGSDGCWPSWIEYGNKAQSAASIRTVMGLGESDVVVGPAFADDEIVKNPEAWIMDEWSRVVGMKEEMA